MIRWRAAAGDAVHPLLDRIRTALAPQYEVHGVLGEGGMGVVVAATEVALRREVAIKVLRPELASAPFAERFTREAQHLARVRHRHVVTIHRVGEAGGLFFAVMERVGGETLDRRLARAPLTPPELRRFGAALLDGLAAVHGANLIHRDIKPSNLFVHEGEAVLADFGIARSMGVSGSAGSVAAGTPAYMAPEQRAHLPLTPRTDIHAVGAVLYEAATGRRWGAESEAGRWKGVPRGLRRVLARALQRDPALRWATAMDFRRALVAPRWPPLRPRPAAAGLLGLVALAATAWLYDGRDNGHGVTPLAPPVELTVLPFQGPDTVGAQRVARYLGSQLERFSRWVPVRPVSVSLRPPPPGPPRLAWWGSRYLVSGELTPDGGLTVEVRSGDTERLADQFELRGPHDPLPQAHAAAERLIARLYPGHLQRFRALTGRGGSASPRAVDAFIAGQEAFHHDAYDSARASFTRALSNDPGFALAAWHLALTDRWRRTLRTGDLEEVRRRHAARLAAPYAELLAAQLEPTLDARLARLRGAVEADTAGSEALLLYADELFHRGPLLGLPLDSAVAAFRRAMAVDPHLDPAPALDHTVWAEIHLGRRAAARRELGERQAVTRRLATAGFREGEVRTRFLEFAYHERFVPWRGRLDRLAFLWPGEARLQGISRYVRLGLSFDIPATQVMLGRVLVRRGNSGQLKAQGYTAQGLGLMALGRPAEAISRFDSAATRLVSVEAQLQRAQWRLLPAVLGLPPASPAHVSLGRLLLRGVREVPGVAGRARWTLLLVDASANGQVDSAELAHLRDIAPGDTTVRPLLTLLEARLLARSAGPAAALARTDSLVREGGLAGTQAPFTRALLHLSRASWQEAVGDPEAALRSLGWHRNTDLEGWAEGETQAGDVDGVLGVFARLRSGALLLELGRRGEACPLISRVRELWAGAEAAYAGLRARADSLAARCRG